MAPAWLTARPIAHRGYHDAASGRIENTLSAVAAAIAHRFAVEVDIQLSSDREALVFHDSDLDRLTAGSGPVANRTAAELRALQIKGTTDRIPTFGELLDFTGGRTPLVVEIKSRWRQADDRACIRRVADVARDYRGPLALMSFDPNIVAMLARELPDAPRGIVAEATRDPAHWGHLSALERTSLRHLLHVPRSRPDFVAYHAKDLPAPAPALLREIGLPLLAWTVRSPEEQTRALRHADQIIFENFDPDRGGGSAAGAALAPAPASAT